MILHLFVVETKRLGKHKFINTANKNPAALLEASKGVCLEIMSEKTK
jgi:hypothetical protein